ncbi:Protein of unknown function, partial [Gryllus bimaculatus]
VAWNLMSSIKSGAALFFYGPMCLLVVVNAVCITHTMRKVQFLQRGNSVLHREDDKTSRGRRQAEGSNTRATNRRNREAARSTVVDAKTIRVYIKMFLMTGMVEFVAEIIVWNVSYYSWKSISFLPDHILSYRATGYAADCLRAAWVVWLAAPEEGYIGGLRRLLGSGTSGRKR